MEDSLKMIENLEQRFSANGYDGSGTKSYVIKKGSIPVMISAPHAVNHSRDGHVKFADKMTGGIALFLHKVTGCHLICASRQIGQDPNYDEESASEYKRTLKNYVAENGIRVLLDLHGASKEREYAVELGTVNDSDQSLRW